MCKAFRGWVDDFKGREMKPVNDEESDQDVWPSKVHYDAFIIIDQPVIDLLLRAPKFTRGQVPRNEDLEPWVVMVSAQHPMSRSY
ncbi:hypothetical protein CFE70_006430 [Pyrenophora teres f. teres 0-1]|uniref:Uncharacterized protein n=1 Tax=Pyrenophora teres f. teres TaxID=97479 RepID=A0A6S6W5M2_9PLEO|nr:hypothetical protein HRS9139_07275 [Pyrenophora teres f. teres]KAE8829523.1 hypothetical protein HRS9122_09338 [Pyrenophora teres f. teres]KAE8830653.1 hypothetical protein PTNB85_07240 [Pyrenophora teres f. teres]KAE8857346.1 hypothetical protein PTNB29_08413 [Pyrenophora teres f. teres]KAE8863305.1 hypothetical protein PTNB73_06512 [Pyrenophora teres f. teres]